MPGLTRSLQSTVEKGSRKLLKLLNLYSEYDQTIPPEIKDDEFFDLISSLGRTAPIRTILEIGSSTGDGSTAAFVSGLTQNPNRPTLYCMEISQPRFEQLVRRYAENPQVKCYNVTSVPLDRLPTDGDVIEFYRNRVSKLNQVPQREVLRWLHLDRRYIGRTGASQNGIRLIKKENGIDKFGMVLIDGSEFSGPAELDEVYGADYLLLDDIDSFKNFFNYERLSKDPQYRLLAVNKELRNGYAAFERVGH